jgi:hypothetical protein
MEQSCRASTQLQAASFDDAQLQGASLEGAQLAGATFRNAQLQGVPFTHAQAQYTLFSKVFVWRAHPPDTATKGIRVIAPEIHPIYQGLECPAQATCNWSVRSVETLRAVIDRWVLPEDRHKALERIAALVPTQPTSLPTVLEAAWIDLAQKSHDDEKDLADWLQKIGCREAGAPYVLHGIVHHLDSRFREASPQLVELAKSFLDVKKCDGAPGLSERNKFDLQELIAASPSPTTSP